MSPKIIFFKHIDPFLLFGKSAKGDGEINISIEIYNGEPMQLPIDAHHVEYRERVVGFDLSHQC